MQSGARTASKEKQGKPNETKEISLDFLFFLWSNWVFSNGYSESKRENSLSPSRPALVVKQRHSVLPVVVDTELAPTRFVIRDDLSRPF
jgi:hypothetical protein